MSRFFLFNFVILRKIPKKRKKISRIYTNKTTKTPKISWLFFGQKNDNNCWIFFIEKNYMLWSEFLRIVACDNYDGFCSLSFLFSQNFIWIFTGLLMSRLQTDPRVRCYKTRQGILAHYLYNLLFSCPRWESAFSVFLFFGKLPNCDDKTISGTLFSECKFKKNCKNSENFAKLSKPQTWKQSA